MKKVKYILLILFCFIYISCVEADIHDYNGGSSSSLGNLGDGVWDVPKVGLKISIVNSEGITEDTEIILNKDLDGNEYFSTTMRPKTDPKTEKLIKWLPVNQWTQNNKYHVESSLPDRWVDSEENYVNLDNELKKYVEGYGNYGLLKKILEKKTKDGEIVFPTLSSGDYIIVEPMAKYWTHYGTAFELSNYLMTGNVDYVFQYYSGAMFGGYVSGYASQKHRKCGGVLWNTIYLESAVSTLGLEVYTPLDANDESCCGANCDGTSDSCKAISSSQTNSVKRNAIPLHRNECLKSKTCGRGIGVYEYNNLFRGNLDAIIRANDVQITNSNVEVEFKLHKGANCSGDVVKIQSTSFGKANFELIPHGEYSLEVVSEKFNGSTEQFNQRYTRENLNSCVVSSININKPTTTIYVDYTTTKSGSCEAKLNALGTEPTKSQLIELFKEYEEYNNLLNFSNPSCIQNTSCSTNNISCLSGNLLKTNSFSENNLSCSDEIIKDASGNPIAFCDYYINFNNQLGTNTFYGISGQFLIKKVNNNIYSINDENFMSKNVETDGNGILKLRSGKVCYILSEKTLQNNQISPKTNSTLNIRFNDKELVGEKTDEQNVAETIDETLKKSEIIYTYKYDLGDVVLDKFTGSIAANSDNLEIIKGLITSFNEKSGIINFSVKYDNTTYTPNTNDSCKSELQQQLIIFPPNKPNGKLNLEFRVVDTNNPFVDRDTNTNWCDRTNCDKENNVVTTVIKNSNNSFNKTGAGPKYKITLNPSDIKIIREYNKDNKYDSYKLYCNASGCRNAFIYSLTEGEVSTYRKISDVRYINGTNYGILSNKLIINDSL